MNEKEKQQRYDLCTRYLSEISKADCINRCGPKVSDMPT